MKKILLLIFLLLAVPFSYSHAGCLKLADDYYVHLSASPLVPVEGVAESFLFSFAGKNGLISNVLGTITIIQGNDIVFEHEFETGDGLYGLKHTFNQSGIYEIYVEFDYNGTHYIPDDFVIEVIESAKREEMQQKESKTFNNFNILFLLIGIAIGMFSSKLLRRRK